MHYDLALYFIAVFTIGPALALAPDWISAIAKRIRSR